MYELIIIPKENLIDELFEEIKNLKEKEDKIKKNKNYFISLNCKNIDNFHKNFKKIFLYSIFTKNIFINLNSKNLNSILKEINLNLKIIENIQKIQNKQKNIQDIINLDIFDNKKYNLIDLIGFEFEKINLINNLKNEIDINYLEIIKEIEKILKLKKINNPKIFEINFNFAKSSIYFYKYYYYNFNFNNYKIRTQINYFKIFKKIIQENKTNKKKINYKINFLSNNEIKKAKENLNHLQIKLNLTKINLDFLDLKFLEKEFDLCFSIIFNETEFSKNIENILYQFEYISKKYILIISKNKLDKQILKDYNLKLKKEIIKIYNDKNNNSKSETKNEKYIISILEKIKK